MITAETLLADLHTHHIEGIAREGHTPFSCPLITPANDHLWQGGCLNGNSCSCCFPLLWRYRGSISGNVSGMR